jgi:MinD-like ATPase involved in chromosome partitioning or flagellar assembly
MCNMAVRLANHPLVPLRVALLDLEKGRGSIRVLFDPRMPPKPGILDFLEWAGDPAIPPESLRGALPKDTLPARKYHLTTVFGPGSYEREGEVSEPLVKTVLASLRLEHDFVLVDLPGDVTDAALTAMQMATTVIWMVRADVKDLERHADILALLRRTGLDTANFRAVVTLVPPGIKPPFSPEQIQKGLGFPLLSWALPYDPRVAMAVPDEFAAVRDPHGAYMTALDHLIAQLCPDLSLGGGPGGGRGWRRGPFGIFGRRG